MKRVALFAAAGIVAAGLSLAIGGAPALAGAGVGVAIAAVMCTVSAAMMRRAQRSEAKNALLAALLGGIGAGFAIMAASLVVVASVRRDLLETAALSALGIYLVCRFAEAFDASRLESARGLAGTARPAGVSGKDPAILQRGLP